MSILLSKCKKNLKLIIYLFLYFW